MRAVRGIPLLRTREEALARWEAIKPMRGGTTRPLSDRNRRRRLSISRSGDTVICHLDNNAVYYEVDGTITLRLDRRGSLHISMFVFKLLGLFHTYRHNMHWIRVYQPGLTYGWVPLSPDNTSQYTNTKLQYTNTKLKLDEHNQFQIVDYTHPKRWVIDKSKMAEVRKPYREFTKFLRGIVKLVGRQAETGWHYDRPTMYPNLVPFLESGNVCELKEILEMALGNTEQQQIAIRTLISSWWNRRFNSVPLEVFCVNALTELLVSSNKDKALELVEVTSGKIFDDKYKWLIS